MVQNYKLASYINVYLQYMTLSYFNDDLSNEMYYTLVGTLDQVKISSEATF